MRSSNVNHAFEIFYSWFSKIVVRRKDQLKDRFKYLSWVEASISLPPTNNDSNHNSGGVVQGSWLHLPDCSGMFQKFEHADQTVLVPIFERHACGIKKTSSFYQGKWFVKMSFNLLAEARNLSWERPVWKFEVSLSASASYLEIPYTISYMPHIADSVNKTQIKNKRVWIHTILYIYIPVLGSCRKSWFLKKYSKSKRPNAHEESPINFFLRCNCYIATSRQQNSFKSNKKKERKGLNTYNITHLPFPPWKLSKIMTLMSCRLLTVPDGHPWRLWYSRSVAIVLLAIWRFDWFFSKSEKNLIFNEMIIKTKVMQYLSPLWKLSTVMTLISCRFWPSQIDILDACNIGTIDSYLFLLFIVWDLDCNFRRLENFLVYQRFDENQCLGDIAQVELLIPEFFKCCCLFRIRLLMCNRRPLDNDKYPLLSSQYCEN